MNTIKTIKDGDYTLEHTWYIDDMGLQRNAIDIIHEVDGMKTHYPTRAPIRVLTCSKDSTFAGDDISEYTDREYSTILIQ